MPYCGANLVVSSQKDFPKWVSLENIGVHGAAVSLVSGVEISRHSKHLNIKYSKHFKHLLHCVCGAWDDPSLSQA